MNEGHGGAALRAQVRAVVAHADLDLSDVQCDSWMRGHDPAFTRALAAAGLVGLTWSRDLGGRESSNTDRLIVTEELLRVGAPVAAHWIADRQIGPAIARHGSRELQEEFLPLIGSGAVTFCLGMSETESGSDLAAVRTRADRVQGGFRVTGRKIWTSHAHRSTHAYVLARTDASGRKHEGLTELIVDLAAEGVEVRPILDLGGEHHFNEMIFEHVFVPDRHVIGQVGEGWTQVTEQLAFERGGIERVLSTYPLLARMVTGAASGDMEVEARVVGGLLARLHTLRAMALDVATAMDRGDAPVQQAALLKYLGNAFEVDVVESFREAVAGPPMPGMDGPTAALADGLVCSPGATLRGGTTEMMLGIVGRQVEAGQRGGAIGDADLSSVVGKVLATLDRAAEDGSLPPVWSTALELGWTGIGISEERGGSGGGVEDLAAVAMGLARAGHASPIVETALVGLARSASGHDVDPSVPATFALGPGVRAERVDDAWVLDGAVAGVPWAAAAEGYVLAASTPDGERLLVVPRTAEGVTVTPARNLAGEPRDTITFTRVRAAEDLGGDPAVITLRNAAVTMLVAATVGALEGAVSAAVSHAQVREQFGKPLAAFQAVSHSLARMAGELSAARVALAEALAEIQGEGPGWRVLAARVVAARASSAVARAAHQVLGAMGTTQEHELHLYTLRLWSWRDALISERAAAHRLGTAAVTAGAEQMWNWCVHEVSDLGHWPDGEEAR